MGEENISEMRFRQHLFVTLVVDIWSTSLRTRLNFLVLVQILKTKKYSNNAERCFLKLPLSLKASKYFFCCWVFDRSLKLLSLEYNLNRIKQVRQWLRNIRSFSKNTIKVSYIIAYRILRCLSKLRQSTRIPQSFLTSSFLIEPTNLNSYTKSPVFPFDFIGNKVV